jgi:hypothetical protein
MIVFSYTANRLSVFGKAEKLTRPRMLPLQLPERLLNLGHRRLQSGRRLQLVRNEHAPVTQEGNQRNKRFLLRIQMSRMTTQTRSQKRRKMTGRKMKKMRNGQAERLRRKISSGLQ